MYISNLHITGTHTFAFIIPFRAPLSSACLTKCQAVLCSFPTQELGFVMGNHTLSLSPEDITFPQQSGITSAKVIKW